MVTIVFHSYNLNVALKAPRKKNELPLFVISGEPEIAQRLLASTDTVPAINKQT